MQTPLEARPKISNLDIRRGYIKRYFTQMISTKKIYEIDKTQYDAYLLNSYFVTIQLSWVIDTTDPIDTSEKNTNIINYYNKKMPGLSRKLRNPVEYIGG